ncbi:hypothetical protein PoHVEF18_003186 [Penicillium ochrochloron]
MSDRRIDPAHLGQRMGLPPSDSPIWIPVIRRGILEAPPGDWSALIRTLPFSKARVHDDSIKTPLLRILYEQIPLREPMISNSSSAQPEQLFRMIGSSTANIESAMIQIGGTRAEDDSCLECLQGRGTWNSCVYVGWEGVKICVNCHWRSQDSRCYWPTWEELNPDPAALRVNDYDSDSGDGFNDEDGHDGDDGDYDDFHVSIQALNNRRLSTTEDSQQQKTLNNRRLSAIQPSTQRIQVDRSQSLIDQCIRDLSRDIDGLAHAVKSMQRAQDQEIIRVNAELAEARAQLERELRNLSHRSS